MNFDLKLDDINNKTYFILKVDDFEKEKYMYNKFLTFFAYNKKFEQSIQVSCINCLI